MNPAKQIVGLDIIRAGAALLVVLYHLGFAINTNPGGTQVNYHWLDPLVRFGWIGVEVFFVLSGFVIAYSASGSTALNFARSRMIRLYPSAWICATTTLLVLAALHIHQERMFHRYLKSMMLYLQGPYVDGSYWTLPLEIVFYLMIFALLCAKGFRFLEWLMAALCLFSTTDNVIVWCCLRSPAAPHGRAVSWLSTHPDSLLQSLTLSEYGVFFALGALVWLCLFRQATPLRLLGIALSLVGAGFEINRHALDLFKQVPRWETSYWLVPMIVFFTALGIILVAVRYNEHISQALGATGMSITRKLGLMTYPLYLVHQQVGFGVIGRLKGMLGDFPSFVLTSLLLISFSFMTVTFLEEPLQNRLRALLHASHGEARSPVSSLP